MFTHNIRLGVIKIKRKEKPRFSVYINAVLAHEPPANTDKINQMHHRAAMMIAFWLEVESIDCNEYMHDERSHNPFQSDMRIIELN